jgi:hypothetical protein
MKISDHTNVPLLTAPKQAATTTALDALGCAWTHSLSARSGCALSLHKSRLACSQLARLAGRLVAQDPTDEPAEKLLELIRGIAKIKT